MINPLNNSQSIVGNDGRMIRRFKIWAQSVTRLDPIVSAGSPEGVIPAQVGRFYIDDTGTAGNILYVKRDADIGGDTTQGWILV